MNRLETLSADLAAKLRRASPAKQYAACVAACELAVAKTKIEHPLVDELFRQVRVGHVFTPQEKAAIDALVAQLDEKYFDLQEAAEAGKAPATDYLRAFEKARAVAALSFAGDHTPDAVAEAIYEAAAAVGDDKSELFSLIESSLK
jgi:hypothetical protein